MLRNNRNLLQKKSFIPKDGNVIVLTSNMATEKTIYCTIANYNALDYKALCSLLNCTA